MKFKKLLLWALIIIVSLYLFVYGILPIVFHYSYWLQTKLVFLNHVYWPRSFDFSNPLGVGLKARNFYLTTDENVKLGVWQVLPLSLLTQKNKAELTETDYLGLLKNATSPVILYMHGNAGNRGSSHRVGLYKLFQKEDYHVISFDYRTFGDSDEDVYLSETGVVNDSKFVLDWLIKTVRNSNLIYVWGHSLGTAISIHALALHSINGKSPAGLFLEAPFNNLQDEILFYPISRTFQHLPWFDWAILKPLYDNKLRFESDKHILKVECPIMFLHAEDDKIVPFSLGQKLYNVSLKGQTNSSNQFTRIKGSLKLGHKNIYLYKELPAVIRKFIAGSTTTSLM